MLFGARAAGGAGRRSLRAGLLVPPARPPRPVAALLILVALAWASFAVGTFFRSGDSTFWDVWVYDGITSGCAVIAVARAVAVRTERAAWAFVACGLVANAGGDLATAVIAGAGDPPFPSIADAFYLMLYPFLYLALILLTRDRMRRFPLSAWLDGVVSGLAMTALVAAVAFQRISSATHGSHAAVAVGLAYPIGDLMLLAMVGGSLAMIGWRADSRWWLLSGGFALYAVADTIYLFRTASNTYTDGTWLDALWPGASLLVAFAGWRPSRRLSHELVTSWRVMAPSLIGTLGAVAVLSAAAGPRVSIVAVVLAAVTLLAATARFALGFREVTQLAESRRQAMTDELTGLANRRALLRALSAPGSWTAAALLLIDLDRFKEVNDSLGHHVGDELLVQVSRRLAAAGTMPSCVGMVARLGGDEFAVLLTPARTKDRAKDRGADAEPVCFATAQEVAGRIVKALQDPFALDDVTLHVEASVGIGLLPEHATEPPRLLQRADVAMYTAKTGHGRVAVYRPEDDPHSKERLHLIEELRAGLADGQVICHYQPLVDLASGVAFGVEALARWNHPSRGLLPPDEFLPLAEHAGLMRELTAVVLRQSLGQVRRWMDQGIATRVSVNLSPTNLLDVDLPDQINACLVEFGVPGPMLRVEITETVLMTNFARSQQILDRLRGFGVEASIDDYGTGYSSLSYLQDLTVDELKLDRAFITRLLDDARAAAIVASTVDLAHSLDMRLVAEGVSDAATSAALRGIGCDIGQGFYYCRPQPGDVISRWLVEHGGHTLGLPIPGPDSGSVLGSVLGSRTGSGSRSGSGAVPGPGTERRRGPDQRPADSGRSGLSRPRGARTGAGAGRADLEVEARS